LTTLTAHRIFTILPVGRKYGVPCISGSFDSPGVNAGDG
jgi:hypothetical protein